MSDAVSPAFDAGGKYLYFLASTDYGPRTGWLEMSSLDRPARRVDLPRGAAGERAVAASFPKRATSPPRRSAAIALASKPRADTTPLAAAHRSRRHRPAHPRAADARPATSAISRRARPGPSSTPRRCLTRRRARGCSATAQGTRGRAVPRGDSLVHALGGSEEAALSGRARRAGRPLGNRRGPTSRRKLATARINVGQLEMLVDPRAEWARDLQGSVAHSARLSSTTRRCTAPTGRPCTTSTARSCRTSAIAPTSAISSR